jgi:hypothetical protein
MSTVLESDINTLCQASMPNGVLYAPSGCGWERKRLENGKLLKLRNISKKRGDAQPSGARREAS